MVEKNNKKFLKIKIGVCGETMSNLCGVDSYDDAKKLGSEIARQKVVLITSSLEGFALWSAMGAKEEGGFILNISPAANKLEHEITYRLSSEYADLMIYSGFGFPGRDLLFTRSCDAIVLGCGQTEIIHQFSLSLGSNKPIGILEGEWPACESIKKIIKDTGKSADNVVFEKDPKLLIKKLIEKIKD